MSDATALCPACQPLCDVRTTRHTCGRWPLSGNVANALADIERDVKPDKPPLEYLGDLCRALEALAHQLDFGARRPGRARACWRAIYDQDRDLIIAKALRHLLRRLTGEKIDKDNRLHVVAALADVAILAELELEDLEQ